MVYLSKSEEIMSMMKQNSSTYSGKKRMLVTDEEALVFQKIRKIVADGQSVEVKLDKDRKYKVLKIIKRIA